MKKIFILAFFLVSVCGPCLAYEQVVYIWQRSWNAHLKDAVSHIKDATGRFTFLGGDLKFDGEKCVVTPVRIKWKSLAQAEAGATLAFRINTHASKFFATGKIYSIADSVSNAITKVIDSAPRDKIVGIQIDYDFSPSKTSHYVKF